MHDYSRYIRLAEKWKNGTITPAEQQELDQWYNTNQDRPVDIPGTLATSESAHEEKLLEGIRAKINTGERVIVRRIHWQKWAVAAAIIIIGGFAALKYIVPGRNNTSNNINTIPTASLEQVLPGTNRATLILSDGKKIELNTAPETINDGNLAIQNINGQVVYQSIIKSGNPSNRGFNTMATPKGGTYQLHLPDGTTVWLNAASSITYPTVFTGKTRTVRLNGEAYFDVSANKDQPFIVETNGHSIQVLGTEFNVNAYTDEPVIQTTLISGSVKVADKIIKPGEAFIGGTVKKVNTNTVIAWKNGSFRFESADLKTLMRQIGRWYDIDISYEGEMSTEKFEGELKRNLNLSQIMKLLSYMDIRYRLENNHHLIISGK